MCGICGIVDFERQERMSPDIVSRMNDTIKHRGPDDAGIYVASSVGLGHRRLSIIDVAGGHQPLSNEDGTVWVLMNGEIYNYQEIRGRLLGHGHRFKTTLDPEASANQNEQEGEESYKRL